MADLSRYDNRVTWLRARASSDPGVLTDAFDDCSDLDVRRHGSPLVLP